MNTWFYKFNNVWIHVSNYFFSVHQTNEENDDAVNKESAEINEVELRG